MHETGFEQEESPANEASLLLLQVRVPFQLGTVIKIWLKAKIWVCRVSSNSESSVFVISNEDMCLQLAGLPVNSSEVLWPCYHVVTLLKWREESFSENESSHHQSYILMLQHMYRFSSHRQQMQISKHKWPHSTVLLNGCKLLSPYPICQIRRLIRMHWRFGLWNYEGKKGCTRVFRTWKPWQVCPFRFIFHVDSNIQLASANPYLSPHTRIPDIHPISEHPISKYHWPTIHSSRSMPQTTWTRMLNDMVKRNPSRNGFLYPVVQLELNSWRNSQVVSFILQLKLERTCRFLNMYSGSFPWSWNDLTCTACTGSTISGRWQRYHLQLMDTVHTFCP